MRDTFRIIAIRTPKLPADLSTKDKENALRMMKKIGENSRWLYFYNDYAEIDIDNDFTGKFIVVEKKDFLHNRLYDLDNIHVNVSAIVGKNGTGKSSIIDLLIRTINNIAAAVIGEQYVFEAAEHLHFIENVYSDLCYELDNKFYIIELRGRKVMMHIYSSKDGGKYYIKEDEDINILDDRTDRLGYISEDESLQNRVLSRLFYSLICNYSMYGFNYRDYIQEQTPLERLKKIYDSLSKENKESINVSDSINPEDTVWLKGLFYKNDGYQTPIVIHPMRHDGMINVNAENDLAKEKLLKMFFYRNSREEYPLRMINGNIYVQAIELSLSNKDYGTLDAIAPKIGITKYQNLYKRNFAEISEIIIKYWLEKSDVKADAYDRTNPIIAAVYNYIVYKTIKIAYIYQQYSKLKKSFNTTTIDSSHICVLLDDMAKDRTFKTRKLVRAINFLRTDLYRHVGRYDLNDLTEQIDSRIVILESANKKVYNTLPLSEHIDAYLPPPIFEYDFILKKWKGQEFKFEHLSSGEKQIAYTISSFIYHIHNIDSAWYSVDYTHKYRYINAIFDEVEQYYHPDLQRRFLSYLLDGLSCMEFKGLKAINILIVTHSPFVLSDIPKGNILALRDMNDPWASIPETFCGNINEMLALPFFMDYSMGEVARRKIEEIIDLYESIVENKNTPPKNVAKLITRYTAIARLVGDSYIRGSLKEMLAQVKNSIKNV